MEISESLYLSNVKKTRSRREGQGGAGPDVPRKQVIPATEARRLRRGSVAATFAR